jgi:hypothetical protein
MKRSIIAILVLCVSVTAYAAKENLYEAFKDHDIIRVSLDPVENDVTDPQVTAAGFTKIFEETLPERLNIAFSCVKNTGEADVVVKARIKKYAFKEKVPPRFFSTASLIADTTAPKSSAKLVVDYEIIDAATGKALMEFKNFTTEERRPIEDMTGEQGFSHAASKNINRFLYRAFYRQRK